jgi:hypothetical protein
MIDSKLDHLWHVWINQRANDDRGYDKPCVFCGKLFDEHETGEHRHKHRCPGHESQFFTPPMPVRSLENPPIDTMYAFKSAVQFMPWAGEAIKRARTGQLRTMHQHCSHCKPEPVENNVMRCWLGKDVAKCPILDSLKASIDEDRKRTLPDGRPSYYAEVTDDQVYELMGMVCTWHLLMSHVASEAKELPPPSYVDWNDGAFQDESDRRFWQETYKSMTTPEEGCDEPEPEGPKDALEERGILP